MTTNKRSQSRDEKIEIELNRSPVQTETYIKNSAIMLVRAKMETGLPVVYISDNVTQLGYTAADFISGKVRLGDLVHPDDLETNSKKLIDVIKNGLTEYSFEYRILTATKEVRWIEDRIVLERNNQGRVTYLQGVMIDITDRKIHETLLANSLAKESWFSLRLKRLNKLSYALSQAVDFKEIYQTLFDEIDGIVPIDRINIALLEPDREHVCIVAYRNHHGMAIEEEIVALADTMMSHAIQKKTILISDTADTKFIDVQSMYSSGFKTVATAPLIAGDIVLGAIGFSSMQHHAFDENDMTLFQQLSFLLAAVINNHKLLEHSRYIYQAINHSAAVLFQWQAEKDFPIYFVSDNIAQFGYTAKSFIMGESSFLDIVYPPDLDILEKQLTDYHNREHIEDVKEYRIISADNQIRWIEDRSIIERDELGRLLFIYSIIIDITERKQSAQSLEIMRYSIESANHSVLWIKMDGSIAYANQAATDLLGYTNDELCTSFLFDIHTKIDTSTWHEYLNARNKQKLIQYETNYLHKDGHSIPVEISTNYYQYDEQKYLFVFVKDITDRRLTNERLALANKMIERSPIMLIRWRRSDWQIVYASKNVQQMGYSADELISNQVSFTLDIIHPEDVSAVREYIIEKALHNIDEFEFEYRIVTRDGNVRWVIDLSSAERNDKGDVEFHQAMLIDITEKREIQAVLEESSANQRNILEYQPISICITRYDGSFLYINQAYQQMFGVDQIRSKTYYAQSTYYDSDDRIEVLNKLRRNGHLSDYETRCIRSDGTDFWVSMSMQLIEYAGERVILTSMFDLTHRKQTEMQLEIAKNTAEKANKAKSDFLSSMSHELRTPLNGILGYTQILQRDTTLLDEHRQAVNVMHQSGEHLLALINNILDIAKVEANKLELNKSSFHLSSFIKEVSDIIMIRAGEKGLQFINQLDASLPLGIVADKMRLRQVLLNLLSNAIKFTDSGSVTLHAMIAHMNPTGITLCFEVCDTGVGIDPENLDKIFGAFEQVGDWQSRRDGTGLGLAISKKIVAEMGGELQVESTVGQGSRFWFELTTHTANAHKKHALSSQKRRVGYEGIQLSILVVGDNPINSEVLTQLLTNLYFVVEKAGNGFEALEKLTTFRPDIIISDLVMPQMNGYEMMRRIRNYPELRHIPAIAVSASTEELSGSYAYDEISYHSFHPKPINISELLDSIGEQLNISWIYEQDSHTVASANPMLDVQAIHFDLIELKALYDMAFIGDLKGVLRLTDTFKNSNPKRNLLLEHIRVLACSYEDETLIELLISCIAYKEPK